MKGRRLERWAGPIYLDASAVVKLFVPEAESDDLNEALLGGGRDSIRPGSDRNRIGIGAPGA